MWLNVITCNDYKKSSNGDHYHEIHEVTGIQSVPHAISIINDIIENNLKYGCKETILSGVYIYTDSNCLDIKEYYEKHNTHNIYIEVH